MQKIKVANLLKIGNLTMNNHPKFIVSQMELKNYFHLIDTPGNTSLKKNHRYLFVCCKMALW